MKREYISRGRPVAIEELEGMAAVMPDISIRLKDAALRAFGDAVRDPEKSLDADDWRAMEDAGWVFARPSREVGDALREGGRVAGAKALRRVFRFPDGSIHLGSDRLCVRLREELTEDEARQVLVSEGLEELHTLKFASNLFKVRVRPGRDFLEACVQLSKHPDFRYAVPAFIEHLPGRVGPAEPEYANQWHLKNTGLVGKPDADIKAVEAWKTSCGAGVRVAVIDSEFDIAIKALSEAATEATGYFEADENGDAVFVRTRTGVPVGPHGTFCATLAVARASNGVGGVGVAYEADLIAVACPAIITECTLARAIAQAANPGLELGGIANGEGADVISCSLGARSGEWVMSDVLQDAIDYAITNGRNGLGTPVFWAVSNKKVPIGKDQVCSYAHTIAVGRSTSFDLVADCAYGSELDFLAPGERVFSSGAGGAFGSDSGTSFATPIAAGIGALVLAVNPGLPWHCVREVLRDSCDRIGGVNYGPNRHHELYGYGRVNAGAAVEKAKKLLGGP